MLLHKGIIINLAMNNFHFICRLFYVKIKKYKFRNDIFLNISHCRRILHSFFVFMKSFDILENWKIVKFIAYFLSI